MRIRSIKPEFCTDEKIGALSREARLHFVMLWMAADRHGTIEYKPRQLAAMLYPFDEDMENSRFEALTSEVLQQSLCSRFTANGRDYLHITNFEKHQALTTWERKDSRVLLPPKELRKYCGSTAEVLRSEERRGEESTEPPNPHGGLSECEIRFVPMMKALESVGKLAESMTPMRLATLWQNTADKSVDPQDPKWLAFLEARAAGVTGKISSLAPWLSAALSEYSASRKKNNGDKGMNFGPTGGAM